ncbi:MAG TPA: GvpL/GvpF family gas vesicle protein [Thermoleophilaceae bacterium]|nr:GvpL/GvpF family gas vesicle protein [Thermoleophilaceae bacterium]
MIELYAITDNPGPPLPELAPELRLVPFDGLAAVCMPASKAEVSPQTLWHHEEVVEALMADRDLLPVRYGTRLDDEAEVARAMEGRSEELAAALDRVRGAVELSVRVMAAAATPSPPDPVATTSGAEYLRLRAQAEASREDAAGALHEPLAALARESAQGRPRPPELFRAAYLVERGAVDSFVAEVGRLQGESPGLAVLCTGPWPPYSFADR